MTDKELKKYIEKRISHIQTNFDIIKSTLLTAGLIVAVSISVPGIKGVVIFGHSGAKTILAFAIMSAIFQLLSFVFAEHQFKRHDKMINSNITTIR